MMPGSLRMPTPSWYMRRRPVRSRARRKNRQGLEAGTGEKLRLHSKIIAEECQERCLTGGGRHCVFGKEKRRGVDGQGGVVLGTQ